MTERFTEWLFILQQRDWALTQFTVLAFWAVMGWEGIRLWPARYQRWFRIAYLIVGGIAFYAIMA